MRYMISVIDNQSRSPHSPEEIAAIDDFNDLLVAKGYRILAVGLEDPKSAQVFDYRAGQNSITAGPFLSSTEFVSGIWIIDVPTPEIAAELAAQGSQACNRRVELRAIIG